MSRRIGAGERPRHSPEHGPGYVPGVHAARAVAVTMVVLVHLIALWSHSAGFEWAPFGEWRRVVNWLGLDHQAGGHVGLLVFFLVSGYIVSQAAEGEGVRAFLIKRVARVIPAMLFAVVLMIGVSELGQSRGWPLPSGYDATRVFSADTVSEMLGFSGFTGGPAVLSPIWSISVEYWWYGLLALTLAVAATRRRPVLSTLLISAVPVLIVWRGAYDQTFTEVGPLDLSRSFIPYVELIVIGRWIYLIHSAQVGRAAGLFGVLSAFALYGLAQQHVQGDFQFITGVEASGLSVIFATAIFVALLTLVTTGPWRPVSFIADISYSLYLLHFPVMWSVFPVLSWDGDNFALALAATLAILIFVSWLSFRFIETPARRIARAYLANKSWGRRAAARPTVAPSPTAAAAGGTP